MRTLVIDTATEALSVALFDGNRCIAHSHETLGRGHAEQLMVRIAALPGGGHADRIAVDVGPGSFTGVRVGVAAARALAFAWGASLTGYCALALIAHMARAMHSGEQDIAVVNVGGHGELFWQRFGGPNLDNLSGPPQSSPIAQLAAELPDTTVFGTAAALLVSSRGGTGTAVPIHPDARAFAMMSERHLIDDPHPIYGRDADAVPKSGAVLA